jgi:hypothetical protein
VINRVLFLSKYKMEPRNLNIDKFRKLEDKRSREMKFNNTLSEGKKNLFDSLVNMVVNHKMELQKIPACSHLNTANVWAEKRGLRAGQEDFDQDGHPETVVYNKSGQPFIINGYKLKSSDYPARNAYWGAHPTSEDRAGEPMREWINEQAYNQVIDQDKPWKRTVNTTQLHQPYSFRPINDRIPVFLNLSPITANNTVDSITSSIDNDTRTWNETICYRFNDWFKWFDNLIIHKLNTFLECAANFLKSSLDFVEYSPSHILSK